MKKVAALVVFCILFRRRSRGQSQSFVQYSTKTSSALVTTGKRALPRNQHKDGATNAQTITVVRQRCVSDLSDANENLESIWPTWATVRQEATRSEPTAKLCFKRVCIS